MRRAVVSIPITGILGVVSCSVVSCSDHAIEEPREAQIVNVMAQADESVIRTRPVLSAGKYVKMAGAPYDFFRGTVPLWRSDVRNGGTDFAVSRFSLDVLVPSLGDPHPENFGVLRAYDGTAALEANDFDASDRLPYLWDVRRLAAGMALATLVSNPEDGDARRTTIAAQADIVAAAMTSYRDAIFAAADGVLPPRVVAGMGGPIVDDLFKRSDRDDNGRELDELTTLTGAAPRVRKFKLGVLDPEAPQGVQLPLPPAAIAALPRALADYRASLVIPPAIEELRVLDAVRIFGSGVASWPRVRVLIVVRGPSDDPGDDVMLELKEIADPNVGGLAPPGVYADSLGERVVRSGRATWARLDAEPRWGWTTWLGLPCQVARDLSRLRQDHPHAACRIRNTRRGCMATPGHRPSDFLMRIRRLYLGFVVAAGIYACSEATDGLPLYDVIITSNDGGATKPGDDEPAKPFDAQTVSTGVVLLNEIGAKDEWIEVVNSGTADVDVGGWIVSDRDKDTGEPKLEDAVTFPEGTHLAPNTYLLVKAGGVDGGKPCPASRGPSPACFHAEFGISNKNGETIFLLAGDGGVQGTAVYPPDAANGPAISWSRLPSGDPTGEFVLARATPGTANAN